MTGITRRPVFWIAYAALACVALAIAWRLFPQAIPLVNLDVKMSRTQAIAAARDLATRLDLAPADARTATRFRGDDRIQNYVELEGGGKRAFADLIEGNVYSPYRWEVRLFRPSDIDEVRLYFRPDGMPYGFDRKVPESYLPAEGSRALATEDARRLAESEAREHWGIDFSRYRPLEETQQRRPNGRVDHAFVYERIDAKTADARYRLQIGVSGDRVSGLTHTAFVPQSFTRRFQEMRSANDTIARAATLAAGVLYGLGGCIVGVLWLMRTHWLVWRPALVAGLVVGGLLGAATLAGAPTAWFDYDTAESTSSFWLGQIGLAVALLFGAGLGYTLVFMAAESLTRRAFPSHPQLWHLWSREGAATPQVLGRTVGGYLFVGLELALIAAFYFVTNRWLGWWQPSESLTDPNILGSAVPALGPIALSLQAGFMEESLFRAIPLSLAAIIGSRFGHRGLAIGIAAVVQAIVFGSAHANYPGFPAYSRAVELFVPSLIWALLFLRFGLLVTVLLHATFDLTLFAIPLFLIEGPGATLQRALVIAAGLVPLAIVLVQRWRAGGWHELEERLRNAGWRQHADAEPPSADARERSPMTAAGWVLRVHRVLPILGVIGLALWLVSAHFRADVPPLPQSRAEAIATAEAVLRERGVTLAADWRRLARVRLASEDDAWGWHQFVWRESGPEAYARLVGNVLAPPLWEVRFARFEGDVAERAEEWRVTVDGAGKARQVRHILPEGRPGPSLSRDDALVLAQRALRDFMGYDPAKLTRIGADQTERPARRDWTFLFVDPDAHIGGGGEARVIVRVAGNEVVDAGRNIFIPETWQRTATEREGRLKLAKLVLAAFSGVALIAALIFAATRWARREYDTVAFRRVAVVLFVLSVISFANGWPEMAMALSTVEPIVNQVSIVVVGRVILAAFGAMFVALVAAIGAWLALRQPVASFAGRWPPWLAGACAATLVAGLGAALSSLAPTVAPLWPTYGLLNQAVPPLGALLVGGSVLGAIAAGLFILAWLDHLTHGWQRYVWVAGIVLVVVQTLTAMVGASNALGALIEGLVSSAIAVLIVYGVLRFDLRTVPAYVATGSVLGLVQSAARNGTPTDALYGGLAIAAVVAMAFAATRYLGTRRA